MEIMLELPFVDRIPEDERDLFLMRMFEICEDLRLEPLHLVMVMYFESKLNPQKENPSSSAVGLIQFLRSTATNLGTTRARLLKMTATEQLEYVHKYLIPFRGRMNTFLDTYFAVFYPKAMGKADNWKFPFPAATVRANHWFDINNDGKIEVWEVREKLRDWFQKQGLE